jgi:ferredoxin
MEKKREFYKIGKKELGDFIQNLIDEKKLKVIGVKERRGKFIYAELESKEEMRFDFDLTAYSPKYFFFPSEETLLKFNLKGFEVEEKVEITPVVFFGIHPYDLHAIKQMDQVFADFKQDPHYLKKRENSVLIGFNPLKVSPNSFAGSMGTGVATDGFDLMLTRLEEEYAIEIGTERGKKLLKKYSAASVADDGIRTKVEAIEKTIPSLYQKKLNFSKERIPKILEQNYQNPLWEKKAEKCLKCGSCNLVCPTCFCFDIKDKMELNLEDGSRVRLWDGCLLEDFAKVASGENFRATEAARYRHRFFRKGKYLPDRYQFIACVGCGRCTEACLPDIANPVEVLNTLWEVSK